MFFHYIHLALLSLRKTPVISALMLLAIAIGIGISMTTLTMHSMRSANPIPQKSDKLAVIQLQTQDSNNNFDSPDNLHRQVTYRDSIELLKSDIPKRITALFRAGLKVAPITPPNSPDVKATLFTTSDFFSMFEVPFLFGNAWTKQDDEFARNTIVISRELNQQLFAGRNSVGEKLLLQNQLFEVVGVIDSWQPVPRYYDVTTDAFGHTEHIFVPLLHAQTNKLDAWNNIWGNTQSWANQQVDNYQQFLESETLWLHAWAEFESAQQKQQFATYIQAYIQQQQQIGRFKRENASYDLKDVMTWLAYRDVVGQDNYILLVLSFLFLAVCLVNTLGLMLTKFLRRAPDVGVRRALGATKSQIFIQHLIEVALLGLFGGVLGIAVTQVILKHIQQYSGEYQLLAKLDLTMVLTAPAIAITVTILAGLYPAWRICQTQPARYLKSQ
ncbi:ABC transporter permease (plasmid) [Catenovulum sp. SX2]|uniref:ABC transporter permease n=1 Tax=Catenovulum sp. SX2 TaxID=3398614 RepID=UPI003F860152